MKHLQGACLLLFNLYSTQRAKDTHLEDVLAIIKIKANHMWKMFLASQMCQCANSKQTTNYAFTQDYCNIRDYFMGSFFTEYKFNTLSNPLLTLSYSDVQYG